MDGKCLSSGGYSKGHKLSGFKSNLLFLMFLETGSQRSACQHRQVLGEGLCLVMSSWPFLGVCMGRGGERRKGGGGGTEKERVRVRGRER